MNNKVKEYIDWLSSAILEADKQAEIFTQNDMYISAECSEAMSTAYKIALEKAEQLLKTDTGAITEAAHFANTQLGELPPVNHLNTESTTQADSSETWGVRQNEQTVKVCDHAEAKWEHVKFCRKCNKSIQIYT